MQYPTACTSLYCGEVKCPADCPRLPQLKAYKAWRDNPANRTAAHNNLRAAAAVTDYTMEALPGLEIQVELVKWNRPKAPRPVVEQGQLALDGAYLGPLFA